MIVLILHLLFNWIGDGKGWTQSDPQAHLNGPGISFQANLL